MQSICTHARAIRVGHVAEDMVGEGILAQDDEEEGAPSALVTGGVIQHHKNAFQKKHHKNEHLDVEDGKGLGMDDSVLGLVGVEGSGTIRDSLAGGLDRPHERRPEWPCARAGGGGCAQRRSRA